MYCVEDEFKLCDECGNCPVYDEEELYGFFEDEEYDFSSEKE